MKKTIFALLLLFAALPLRAQFFQHGTDPGRLHWYSLESPHYKIIYPEGADSLARSYARLMEQFREPVGRSIGFTPGNSLWKKMPVVLHTHHVYSNGSVAYAPTRIDLFTVPEPYGSDPISWDLQLVSHEPRHQAQLEKLESRGLFRGLSFVIGQGSAPLAWQLYMAAPRGEGDAVAVETGLVNGTRARTADFLGYMRVAFDQGDWRDFTRWTKGSFKNYAPDHYKAGYMLMAGTRYLYDNSMFTAEGVGIGLQNPLMMAPFNFDKEIKKLSGKSTAESFREVQEAFNKVWREDDAARGPFLEQTLESKEEAFPVEYATPIWIDGAIYAIRSGYLIAPELVRIEGDKVEKLCQFSSHASSLFYDEPLGRLYWSETVQHPRWDLAGSSIIRYYDLSSGKVVSITHRTRFYSPQPSDNGQWLSVVENNVDGSSASVIISALDGRVDRRVKAPDGVQLTESAWFGDTLFFLGLNADGYGVYRLKDGTWETVLAPSHQKMVNFASEGRELEWVSDRTGVNELYRYDIDSGTLFQMTNTHYGTTDFCEGDGKLYGITQTLKGRMLVSMPLEAISPKAVNHEDLHKYVIEDAITAQERALGPGPDFTQEVPLSAPKKYSKILHPLRLHTWTPFYVNVDEVTNISMENLMETVSPGLTGFFQNTLSTFYGQVGYTAHPDPDKDGPWRHAIETKFTYTGLYPVIEGSLTVGGRSPLDYYKAEDVSGGEVVAEGFGTMYREAPYVSGQLRAYVPLSSSIGGKVYGLIPQVAYIFNNNFYKWDSKVVRETDIETEEVTSKIVSGPDAHNILMQKASLSLRGYYMLPKAPSQIYPRYGIGFEGGIAFRPGLTSVFHPVAYGYAYGYLPGIARSNGIRLTGMIQRQLGNGLLGDQGVNYLPRGYDVNMTALSTEYPTQWKVTADYAIPIYLGDLSIPVIGYIRNFVLTPHADYTGFRNDNLWSVGADFYANMGQIFLLSLDANLGVSFNYLRGSLYEKSGQRKPWSVSLIFSLDF